jgi:hypothetical protein
MGFGEDNLPNVSTLVHDMWDAKASVIFAFQVNKSIVNLEVPKFFRCGEYLLEEGVLVIFISQEFDQV